MIVAPEMLQFMSYQEESWSRASTLINFNAVSESRAGPALWGGFFFKINYLVIHTTEAWTPGETKGRTSSSQVLLGWIGVFLPRAIAALPPLRLFSRNNRLDQWFQPNETPTEPSPSLFTHYCKYLLLHVLNIACTRYCVYSILRVLLIACTQYCMYSLLHVLNIACTHYCMYSI